MSNKITVMINRKKYVIVADEEENYILQCAETVDNSMREILNGTALSENDGAVLAAMNLADSLYKEKEVSDNLRKQLKQALDDNALIAKELSEKKKELKRALKMQKGENA